MLNATKAASHFKEEVSKIQQDFERDCRRAAVKAALKLVALALIFVMAALVAMRG